MTRLVISPRAEQDLREISIYIARDDLNAAISFVERLRQRCRDLLSFSGVGRYRNELQPGYRSITEGDYVILYRLSGKHELIIVRIVHGKRDLSRVFKD